MRRRMVLALFAFVLAAAAAGFVLPARISRLYRTDGGACAGIRWAGEPIPERDLDAWAAERARRIASRRIHVAVEGLPGLEMDATLEELGLRLDVERMAALTRAIGHRGTLFDRLAEARRARRGAFDLPLAFALDVARARRVLDPIKEAADAPPSSARLDVVRREIRAETPGQFVDLEDAFAQIREIGERGGDALRLRRQTVPPLVSAELLGGLDVSHRLARFETGFSRAGDQASRARNIENAAAKLDGVVLFPGELFSFNAVVGPRTPDNGFSKGWQIFKGETVEGVGGGTCQVASTLHASALLAGLDIVERLPHSRPSAYIAMGLDATVVYPVVDLKLRNPFGFPIVLHSAVDGNRVSFELWGREQPARVVFGREVLATRAFERKVEEMPGLAPTRVVRKQHGIRGYKIRRTRTISFRDGTARHESNVDVYPPTLEEYLVGRGADIDALLPHVEDEEESAAATHGGRPGKPAWVPVGAPGAAASGPCDGPCTDAAAKIVDAPGAHAPTALQLRAPTKVVITGAP